MTTLYLVRHGETDWNKENRAQGRSDQPLNATGAAQARALADSLADVAFSGAFASDMSRAVETARPVLAGRDLRLTTVPGFREQDFGDWEGLDRQEVAARYPEEYRALMAGAGEFAPPGGETDTEFLGRVSAAVSKLGDLWSSGGENLLVVAHGGVVRALIVNLLGLGAGALWRFRLANGSLSIVAVFGDGRATLDLMNDTSHLGGGFRV